MAGRGFIRVGTTSHGKLGSAIETIVVVEKWLVCIDPHGVTQPILKISNFENIQAIAGAIRQLQKEYMGPNGIDDQSPFRNSII